MTMPGERRLHAVPWRDLATLSPAAAAKELLLPLPWLGLSLALASAELYPAALAMSFVFFLTGLRVVHGAYHYALGLSRRSTEWVMVAFSILMLGSMHAIQWNHLQHHRHCLAPDDIEAIGARRSAFGAILLGPLFPLRLHSAALARAPAPLRRWISTEHGALARTIRSPLRNALSFNMFFHLEHHLFPQVPTAHLPVLARRLDRAVPEARWPLAW
jgi:fatty acid desaturase